MVDATQEVTDEQILRSLLIKRDKLFYELNKLNVAIDLFQPKSNSSIASSNLPLSKTEQTKKFNAEQLEKGEYSQTFSALEQLHFALKHFGSASLQDISAYIYEFDKNLHISKLVKRLTDVASLEFRKNRLNGFKSDGRYIYSLKEQE